MFKKDGSILVKADNGGNASPSPSSSSFDTRQRLDVVSQLIVQFRLLPGTPDYWDRADVDE